MVDERKKLRQVEYYSDQCLPINIYSNWTPEQLYYLAHWLKANLPIEKKQFSKICQIIMLSRLWMNAMFIFNSYTVNDLKFDACSVENKTGKMSDTTST